MVALQRHHPQALLSHTAPEVVVLALDGGVLTVTCPHLDAKGCRTLLSGSSSSIITEKIQRQWSALAFLLEVFLMRRL